MDALTVDGATAKKNSSIVIGDHECHDDAQVILGRRLNAIPDNSTDTRRVPIGRYNGLRFGLVLHPFSSPDVYLEGQAVRQSMLSREHQGPRAVLNALERLAKGYDSECNRTGQDRDIAEAQLRDYQARLEAPFQHTAYLDELTALRDQLKTGLSGTAEEGKPTVSELADRIKALKAAHAVEGASQRTVRR